MNIGAMISGQTEFFFLIAGPCVIESEAIVMECAGFLTETCARLGIPFIFKASFDKANRTHGSSFRGIGFEAGLAILAKVRKTYSIPILTDIHDIHQIPAVSSVVDILQIPAFLCRQTDLIAASVQTGLTVNLKKGQFISPDEMCHAIHKAKTLSAGRSPVMVTERGFCLGYHNLVVDMRSLEILRSAQVPIIFDGTHSVQRPGQKGAFSSGEKEFIFPLCRAAIAVGVSGLFLETHPSPDQALSDAATMLPLNEMPEMLAYLRDLDAWTRSRSRNDT